MNTPALLQPTRPVAFPATYLEARNALARCELVDECKEMADKAAAIEVYARQSKDDSLVIMAQRIQARAIRRMGELIQQIPSARGARTDIKPTVTRMSAARAAGLSEFQQATALRVAAVPAEHFERLVEAEKPMRANKIAAIGRKRGGRHANKHSQRVHRNCPSCTCREGES